MSEAQHWAGAFRAYTASRESSAFQQGITGLADAGRLDRASIDNTCVEHAVENLADVKQELLDLLMYYIRLCLADHDLNDQEMRAIRDLKRLFRIEEGDCLALCSEEVSELLAVQMRRILADRQVDQVEALQKVQLQEAFDLGYDKVIELTRPFVEETVADIFEEATHTEGADIRWTERRISALDTVYDFNAFLDRHVADVIADIEKAGRGYEASLLRERTRSRHIPQDVKDQVWRRDQGRCVQCGSNEELEFDHIIPFSRGGASTYRNVQLLCEICNRRKSDTIG